MRWRLPHSTGGTLQACNALCCAALCCVCRSLLKRGSVSLVPGGIAEMFLWEQDREAIKVCWRWWWLVVFLLWGAAEQ